MKKARRGEEGVAGHEDGGQEGDCQEDVCQEGTRQEDARQEGPGKKAAAKTAPAKKAAGQEGRGEEGQRATKAPAKKAAAKKAPAKKATVTKKAPATTTTKTAPRRRPPPPERWRSRPTRSRGPRPSSTRSAASSRADVERLPRARPGRDELADLMRDAGEGAGNDQADVGLRDLRARPGDDLVNNARDMLAQSEHALDRIADGTYGVCESCGNPIGKKRLMAFPRATLCLTCKQREERR